MELTSQNDSFYASTAPTSPSTYCSNSPNSSMQHFYSAPASPIKTVGYEYSGPGTPRTNQDFEFETSKKFRLDGLEEEEEFETSPTFWYKTFNNDQQQQQQQQQRWGSLPPTMAAFADELFSNGQLVLPLKLPPRLQYANAGFSYCQDSTASSPSARSPMSSVLKNIPFPTSRSIWNDDFDPFAVALENVRHDKRGKSHHRRSRSLSPLRTTTPQGSSDSGGGWLQSQYNQEGRPLEPMQHEMGPNPNEAPIKSKGSTTYARWFQNKNKLQINPHKSSQMESSPQGPPDLKHKGLPLGRIVKTGGEKTEESGGGSRSVEARKQRMKGYLLNYASFGRQKNEVKLREQIAAIWKTSYFSRLSFKFKESAKSNGNKKVNGDTKMELSRYRLRLSLCTSFRY